MGFRLIPRTKGFTGISQESKCAYRNDSPQKKRKLFVPQEVFSLSRYAEGRACAVSGSISVVNDLTRTHPIETVIPTSFEGAPKRLYFRAGNLPTSEHQLKCVQKWLYLCLEKLEFQAPSWETLHVVNRPKNAHKQLFPL